MNGDAVMHQLLALRYQLQAADSQVEGLMKAMAVTSTAECSHPVEARIEDPASGMAEVWACSICKYVYDERVRDAVALEEIDGG